MKWEILDGHVAGSEKQIVETLLKNRDIKKGKEARDFFAPPRPETIKIETLGINKKELAGAVRRIKRAKKDKERVIVYGDYDADGICATAIIWEALYSQGIDALPYIPERFGEGYGLNPDSVGRLKAQNPGLKLIITVDNGIVAHDGVKKAVGMGIDVIICDHHQKGTKRLVARSIIHTTKIGGAGIAWFFARELGYKKGLELAAIGTIADQLPLLEANRSIAKYGLEALDKTNRPGLLALMEEAGLAVGLAPRSVYEVGFIIAPRINSMGRMEHAIESLRLLCTGNRFKAGELVRLLNRTNLLRQNTVEEVVLDAKKKAGRLGERFAVVLASEDYHEGVIGLAAARLVDEFYKPTVVISKKKDVSKASARSISGFNIIENIRKLEELYIEGGGHPMAAGFSIETAKIEEFSRRLNELAQKELTKGHLQRKLKIDLELHFDQLNWELMGKLNGFEPAGAGNPAPTFMTKNVSIVEARLVGREQKHLKLKLKHAEHIFDAIYFSGGEFYPELSSLGKIDIAYQLDENTWNEVKSIQLKIKDIKI